MKEAAKSHKKHLSRKPLNATYTNKCMPGSKSIFTSSYISLSFKQPTHSFLWSCDSVRIELLVSWGEETLFKELDGNF